MAAVGCSRSLKLLVADEGPHTQVIPGLEACPSEAVNHRSPQDNHLFN